MKFLLRWSMSQGILPSDYTKSPFNPVVIGISRFVFRTTEDETRSLIRDIIALDHDTAQGRDMMRDARALHQVMQPRVETTRQTNTTHSQVTSLRLLDEATAGLRPLDEATETRPEQDDTRRRPHATNTIWTTRCHQSSPCNT